jgi:hypothetical protein
MKAATVGIGERASGASAMQVTSDSIAAPAANLRSPEPAGSVKSTSCRSATGSSVIGPSQ